MSSTSKDNLASLSQEELIERCNFLEGERNKRLKAEIVVANAHKLLEAENTRIKSIQSFIGEALKLQDAEELYELTIETIIESFECENALFLLKTQESRYSIVYDFAGAISQEFIELDSGLDKTGIAIDNQTLFKKDYFLNNANFLIASTNIDTNEMLLLAYNLEDTYERLSVEHMNSFQIIANQIGTILENLKTKNEIEELSRDLENKVQQRTQELNQQKKFVQTLLDSQEQLIVTTNGEKLLTANETFFDFFAVDSVEEFMEVYNAKCICETFNTKAPAGYLQIKMGEDGRESWIDYVISRSFGQTHKAMISHNKRDFIFSVSAAKLPGEEGVKSAVFTNITEMEQAKQQIEAIHKHTRESIEYASLIQGALIPDTKIFTNFFQDYFAIWEPKDIVGGDIYLMHELNENELILMVIDCTGHGVPGAFVTMLVKAIERQIMSLMHNDEVISPAKILQVFNRSIKHLLKQESIDSISNAGFDGGILYYNKLDKVVKFAGAETPLFYTDCNAEIQTIKGSRHSVGYKKSDVEFVFQEHRIEVRDGMNFYLTTDGYLDQNGGENGFPFGKKKFNNLILENTHKAMKIQQEIFLNALQEYQKNEERNDDVTLVGFTI
jgi:serine phosphatase RsbU (regulator of sigma subunit)